MERDMLYFDGTVLTINNSALMTYAVLVITYNNISDVILKTVYMWHVIALT